MVERFRRRRILLVLFGPHRQAGLGDGREYDSIGRIESQIDRTFPKALLR
jgi:hypothetical protein